MRFAPTLLLHLSAAAARREYGIFMGLQYYGPPLSDETYERVARAAKVVPLYASVCADHNDTGGGAEHRTGDPGDGGRIVPICDLGDKEAVRVRRGIAKLRDAGAHVLHYTHTRISYWPNGTEQSCCECCEELPYVLSRVANETRNFPRDGIFIDNAIANGAWLPYYKAIVERARASHPARPIAMNPNCAHAATETCSPFCTDYGHPASACADCAAPHCSTMEAEWFDLADVHLLSEGTVGTAQAPDFELRLPFEVTDEHRSKLSMFTYGANASSWRPLIDAAAAKGFSKFWVDGTASGNSTSFLALPPWFEDMVEYIAAFNVADST